MRLSESRCEIAASQARCSLLLQKPFRQPLFTLTVSTYGVPPDPGQYSIGQSIWAKKSLAEGDQDDREGLVE
jgi:hypothetical protein